jgi:hypothetical protein
LVHIQRRWTEHERITDSTNNTLGRNEVPYLLRERRQKRTDYGNG